MLGDFRALSHRSDGDTSPADHSRDRRADVFNAGGAISDMRINELGITRTKDCDRLKRYARKPVGLASCFPATRQIRMRPLS
jgi:hypothetical protein